MTRSEELEQLRELVQRMRTAQREYFRTRSINALDAARVVEKQVDELLGRLAEGQRRLFDEGGE